MCSTEEWEKYLDIKEGSGMNEESPNLCLERVLETG